MWSPLQKKIPIKYFVKVIANESFTRLQIFLKIPVRAYIKNINE